MVKKALGLLFLAFAYYPSMSQVKEMNNGKCRVILDNSSQSNAFTLWNIDNASDTALLENLSYWIFAQHANDSFLSIQNAINFNDASPGINTAKDFGEIYSVTQAQIADHKYLYNSSNYLAPDGIINWPASNNLAAYVNRNGKEGYQPQEGDVPFIRGNHCLLKINNDNQIRSSSTNAMQIIASQYFFNFANAGDPILDKTIGFRWVFQNKSGLDYTNIKLGIHFHSLLQKINSNYIGTDVLNNAMCSYAGDDTSNFISVVLLNKSLDGSMYYTNSGQTANKNDLPLNGAHFTNYLHQKWKDGTNVKIGATGIVGDSIAKYVFQNNTLPNIQKWTENLVGNQRGDRNGLLITQIQEWKNNDFISIEGAVMISENIDGFEALYQRHAAIKNAYNIGNFSGIKSLDKQAVNMYPNPIRQHEKLTLKALKNIKSIEIYDLNGKKMQQATFIDQNIVCFSPNTIGINMIKLIFEDNSIQIVKATILP